MFENTFITTADEQPYIPPSSEELLRTPRFTVYQKEASTKTPRHFVTHPGAVLILPLIDRDTIVMIRNQRYVIGENLLELPAGTKEPGEPSLTTAARELIEETGYKAETVKPLLSFYTTPGFCNERMDAFLAEKLTFIGQDLQEGERIITEIIPLRQCLKLIKDGTIHDGKTIAALLYYHMLINA